MQTTTISGLPYPELPDVPNIPSHIQQFCEAVDTLVISKHASAAARDVAITSPVDGQHVYQLDDNRLYVYKDDYADWFPYQHSVLKAKSALETLGNSTTLQDDNHLINIPLKASTTYIMRGVCFVTSPAAADFKIQWTFSAGTPTGQWAAKTTVAGGGVNSKYDLITTVIGMPTQGSPAVEFITIEGFIINSASPCTMKMQWAKGQADAGTTTVFGGTWVEVVEVL